MTNTSIKNAFERMWQYVLAKLNAKNITYDDTNTALGVENVQEAIEYLNENGGSGGGSGSSFKDVTVPLLLDNWVLDETDNTYSYTTTVNGLTSTSNPIVLLSSSGDEATDDELDSYACISNITTAEDSITFIASEKPSISFTVIVKSVTAAEGGSAAVVTELVTKVDGLETQVGELETQVNTNETNIANNTTAISELNSNLQNKILNSELIGLNNIRFVIGECIVPCTTYDENIEKYRHKFAVDTFSNFHNNTVAIIPLACYNILYESDIANCNIDNQWATVTLDHTTEQLMVKVLMIQYNIY